MSLAELEYKTHGKMHEIEVEKFKIMGQFPMLVVAHLREMYQRMGLPLFSGTKQGVQILLDDVDDSFQRDFLQKDWTLILDPQKKSHLRLAKKELLLKKKVRMSWFSDQDLSGALMSRTKAKNYRGTYLLKKTQTLVYLRGKEPEKYLFNSAWSLTREWAAALCAMREVGFSQGQLQKFCTANPRRME